MLPAALDDVLVFIAVGAAVGYLVWCMVRSRGARRAHAGGCGCASSQRRRA